jgi:hypothetical protein
MDSEAELPAQPIMQQRIRKMVGRPPDTTRVLERLYHVQIFARNITQDRELIREGDYFPVRKVVGRTQRGGR